MAPLLYACGSAAINRDKSRYFLDIMCMEIDGRMDGDRRKKIREVIHQVPLQNAFTQSGSINLFSGLYKLS